MTTAGTTILLGAEGCSEAADAPWLREATPEEVAALADRLLARGVKLDDATIDGIGRPYFAMTVTADAPEKVRAWAERIDRALRLPEGI